MTSTGVYSVMKTLTLVAAAAVVLAGRVSAQVATLDEGSFTITVNGDRAGREDFRIRSTPGSNGPELVATASVSYASRRVLPQLQADSAGVPVRYVVEVKDGPAVNERVDGVVGRGRASAKVKNSRGESANEFVVSQGALVIDDDVFHQYYFITRRARPTGPVSVIVPRRNTQVTMRVADAGSEKLSDRWNGDRCPALHHRRSRRSRPRGLGGRVGPFAQGRDPIARGCGASRRPAALTAGTGLHDAKRSASRGAFCIVGPMKPLLNVPRTTSQTSVQDLISMRLVACALLAFAPFVSAAAQSRDSASTIAPVLVAAGCDLHRSPEQPGLPPDPFGTPARWCGAPHVVRRAAAGRQHELLERLP